MNETSKLAALFIAATVLTGCGADDVTAAPPPGFSRAITEQRLQNAASEPQNWLTHGGTYLEQRHSPLTQINKDTLARLAPAWVFELDTNRGQEATPLVVGRRALYDERLEQGLRAERGDGRADLELRPEGAGSSRRESVLRRELARPRALHGQAHHRDAGRPAHRARPRDRRAGLEHRHRRPDEDVHDHGRAARRQETRS